MSDKPFSFWNLTKRIFMWGSITAGKYSVQRMRSAKWLMVWLWPV